MAAAASAGYVPPGGGVGPASLSTVVLYDSLGNVLLTGDQENIASAVALLDTLPLGKYQSTLPTLTDTRFSHLQLGSRGALQVNLLDDGGTGGVAISTFGNADAGSATDRMLASAAALRGFNGTSWDRIRAGSRANMDGIATTIPVLGSTLLLDNTANAQWQLARPGKGIADAGDGSASLAIAGSIYNGSSWDRKRGNMEGTLLASAARTGSVNSADQTNYNARGVIIFLNVTAVPGGDTIQCKVTAKDPISGSYSSLLTPAAVATTGLRAYIVYPGTVAAASADVTAGALYPLPRTWRIEMVHSAAGSFTYSVGHALIN